MLRSLVDPLWLPLLVLVGIWVVLWRKQALPRWMKLVGTIALATLWFVVTPLGALVIERPLVAESALESG